MAVLQWKQGLLCDKTLHIGGEVRHKTKACDDALVFCSCQSDRSEKICHTHPLNANKYCAVFLSHNNLCYQCDIAITIFFILYT